MKSNILGGLFVLLGILWIVGATHFLFTDFLPVDLQNSQAWAQQVYFPASSISTVLYLGFLLAWVLYSFNSRFTSSVKPKQPSPFGFFCLSRPSSAILLHWSCAFNSSPLWVRAANNFWEEAWLSIRPLMNFLFL